MCLYFLGILWNSFVLKDILDWCDSFQPLTALCWIGLLASEIPYLGVYNFTFREIPYQDLGHKLRRVRKIYNSDYMFLVFGPSFTHSLPQTPHTVFLNLIVWVMWRSTPWSFDTFFIFNLNFKLHYSHPFISWK